MLYAVHLFDPTLQRTIKPLNELWRKKQRKTEIVLHVVGVSHAHMLITLQAAGRVQI